MSPPYLPICGIYLPFQVNLYVPNSKLSNKHSVLYARIDHVSTRAVCNSHASRLWFLDQSTRSVAPWLRETGTPRIPAQRSRKSLWNTALLDIEQISSYYKNNNTRVWCYKEAHQHGDTTAAILHLLYASSGTTSSSGILLAAEQQRRWWTPLCRDSGWDTI